MLNKGIPNPQLIERNKSSKMRKINSIRMKINNPMKDVNTVKKISGESNYNWKGDKVGYSGVHKWIVKTLGKASICSFNKDHKISKFSWANISGSYLRDKDDWSSLCWICHNSYDSIRRGYLTPRGRRLK